MNLKKLEQCLKQARAMVDHTLLGSEEDVRRKSLLVPHRLVKSCFGARLITHNKLVQLHLLLKLRS